MMKKMSCNLGHMNPGVSRYCTALERLRLKHICQTKKSAKADCTNGKANDH